MGQDRYHMGTLGEAKPADPREQWLNGLKYDFRFVAKRNELVICFWAIEPTSGKSKRFEWKLDRQNLTDLLKVLV